MKKSSRQKHCLKPNIHGCGIGIRKGVNLSPFFLFVIFQFLVLLYADDTVLFAKSEGELISIMECFSDHCD